MNLLEEGCLKTVNRLIKACRLPYSSIQNIQDINSSLIVSLFESFTGQNVPDLLCPVSSVDEAHNVQAVIDTLSLDILSISLSHITGEAVVAGDVIAISNLLEIFDGILSYISSEKGGLKIPKHQESSDISKSNLGRVKTVTRKTSKKKTTVTETHPGKDIAAGESIKGVKRKKKSVNILVDEKNDQKENKSSFQPKQYSQTDKDKLERSLRFSEDPTKAALREKMSKFEKPSNNEAVEKLYEENYENKLKAVVSSHSHSPSHRSRVSQIKKLHHQYLRKPVHSRPLPACHKSFLLPHYLRRRSISRISPKRPRILGISPRRKGQVPRKVSHTGLLEELKKEFPKAELPSTVINQMRNKYEDHLMTMHRQLKRCLLKKPKSQIQTEEAAKRQLALSNLVKKDIINQCNLNEENDRRFYQNKLKYHVRDARLQSARMKKYCEEFRNEMRKKMQTRNFSEELIIENTFKEVLNMQKEQVQYLCEQVKETGEEDAKENLQYLNALENLYQNQFSLLAESLAAEKDVARAEIKEQRKVADEMRRDIRQTLQKEVREMQSDILDIVRDPHFRELDAREYKNRVRQRFAAEPK